jgi:hypothetical protein
MPDRHEDVSCADSMFPDFDIYEGEYEQFQWDVHVLIKGTLHACIRFLDSEAKTELAKIDEWMKKQASDEYQQHLVDEHVDVLATNGVQERFLRNMTLVVLASRLTHSLRYLATVCGGVQSMEEAIRPEEHGRVQ